MKSEDPEEFHRRFKQRQQLFLSALDGLTCETSSWQIYLDDQQITQEGIVEIKAIKYGNPSSELTKLREYVRFVTDQGFHLEIVADPDRNFHVVSWEELEPDWPENLDAVLSLRWHAVTGPL